MRSMGGTNDPTNIVELTAREHYMAHWLLHRIHKSRETGAAWASMTSNKHGKRYVSKTWSIAREAGVKSHIGSKRSESTKQKIREAAIGRLHSPEAKLKMSNSRRGSNNHFYGKTHTEETKLKIRENALGKRGKPVIATCMTTGSTYTFPSAYFASTTDGRGIGRDSSTISKVCAGKIKSHNGYTWVYADQV